MHITVSILEKKNCTAKAEKIPTKADGAESISAKINTDDQFYLTAAR